MELWAALIWTGRIVLPIIIFLLYTRYQSRKDEAAAYESGESAKDRYTRGRIMAQRKLVLGEPAPPAMSTMCMKEKAQAPALFEGGGGGGKRGGGGGKSRGKGREQGGDRGDREERGKGERRERRGGGEERKSSGETHQDAPAEEAAKEAVEKDAAVDPASELPSVDDKMQLECLLNYVAFNRKEQQRTFILDDSSAPPPPPPKKKAAPEQTDGQGAGDTHKLSGGSSEKANEEAQMVLRGAMNFKRSSVAKDLYDQLLDSQVEIYESTFRLMIEACVLASDLKAASDFLMKMETSGYCPDSNLLDKVMDLYSKQKSEGTKKPSRKALEPKAKDDTEGSVDSIRVKLKTDAPIFVPSFIPPPPPTSAPAEGAEEKEEEGGEEAPRTKLTASAHAFEPQLNLSFDPYMYTWTMSQSEDEGGGKKGKGKKGKKGSGKGSDGKKGGQKKAAKEQSWEKWEEDWEYWEEETEPAEKSKPTWQVKQDGDAKPKAKADQAKATWKPKSAD